jgi:hypothetical protein
MQLTREELLMKLGAARDQSHPAWRLVTIEVAAEDATFSYRLDRNKLRQTRLRDKAHLVDHPLPHRSHLTGSPRRPSRDALSLIPAARTANTPGV